MQEGRPFTHHRCRRGRPGRPATGSVVSASRRSPGCRRSPRGRAAAGRGSRCARSPSSRRSRCPGRCARGSPPPPPPPERFTNTRPPPFQTRNREDQTLCVIKHFYLKKHKDFPHKTSQCKWTSLSAYCPSSRVCRLSVHLSDSSPRVSTWKHVHAAN